MPPLLIEIVDDIIPSKHYPIRRPDEKVIPEDV
jgi:hypothetical protein